MMLTKISLDLIDPPSNRHRVEVPEESVRELAEDIRDNGLINAIDLLRKGDRYEIIAGERRTTACRYLGWPVITAKVHEDLTEAQVEAIRLSENLQREQLSPMEEAFQVQRLIEHTNGDMRAAAKICKRSLAWLQDRLQLVNVPDDLAPYVHDRTLPIGGALALAEIPEAQDRAHFLRLALTSGVTVPILQGWVRDWHQQKLLNPQAPVELPPLPPAGEVFVLKMDCQLCLIPHPANTYNAKRICPTCMKLWDVFAQTVRDAHTENGEAHATS